MENLFDLIKNNLSKSELNSIPYWDKVRIQQLAVNPEDPEMSHVHLLKKVIDKDHYLLRQVAIVDGEYVKYEQVIATIHHYDFGNGHKGSYRTYHLIKEVWFY